MTGIAAVASLWPLAGRAQLQALPRVAFLSVAFGSEQPVFDVFNDEMRALGQIDGKTFRFELSVAPNSRSIPDLAEKIVRSNPAVLVALDHAAGEALYRLTQTIPIVVVSSGDPVARGWSTSLSRPSRNVTGVLDLAYELTGKRVEILREILPAARRVGVLYENEIADPGFDAILAAAQRAELTIVPLSMVETDDLSNVLARIAGARLDGLIVVSTPYILTIRRQIIESALTARLPTMHDYAFEAQEGGLVAYGTNTVENFERAAQYVARLLEGAKITDLPFDTPRGVSLTVNQRTARAIGVEVSPGLLARADEVLE